MHKNNNLMILYIIISNSYKVFLSLPEKNPLSVKKRKKRLEAPVLGSTRNVRRNRKRRERERLKRCALSLKVAKLTE